MLQDNYNTPTNSIATWQDADNIIGPIEWDWEGWLPKGFLTILASESGVGKSALMLRIGAVYLTGRDWPDGTEFNGQTGAILWCEAEAAQALNIARAKRWGLPLTKFYAPLAYPLDDVNLGSVEHKQAIYDKAILPEVQLICIDSLRGAHRGDEDSSGIISVVLWLAQLARDIQKPVLLSHHLRKRTVFDTNEVTMDRLRGSSAIVQPARLIWALDCPDPHQKDHKRLSVIKSNLSKFPEPIGLRIEESGISFSKAPEEPKTVRPKDIAKELIVSLLEGGAIPSKEVQEAIKAHGISWRTANTAKEELGVIAARNKDKWYWSLPVKDANGYWS